MKQAYRLKSPKDFRLTYKKGKSLVNPYLVLYFRKNQKNTYRIGFSVSKKVGKAVIRNRVKRKLREICRLNEKLFSIGYDYIFVVRVRSKDASYHKLEKNLLDLIHKMRK
ncbi:ribonuclease P protein component [Dehalobacterium formicoaceticum]|uniref:Ribonuclease P protein component n=1 Tax=Dehalobacterium formicoaceticum TaxID=51515 RepID=A0ABT1Y438_9FIRM|nr:ribonuclease P protein component [Dehalobacterium formicoaceticum]MCR6545645.1 ribonuclease P protein component [Dehalobacterium formicoaceticum]